MKLLEILLDLASVVFVSVVVAGVGLLLAGSTFYFLLIMYCWIVWP